MNAAFQIRRAQGKDAQVLSAMILSSKRSNGYDDAFMAACADELSVTPQDIAQTRFWVAEANSLLGCVGLDVDADQQEGHITSFFIAPSAKRQGIGRALWQTVLHKAHTLGIERMTLDADPAAVPFYQALGFATVREVPSGSIAGRMLPRMELVLTQA